MLGLSVHSSVYNSFLTGDIVAAGFNSTLVVANGDQGNAVFIYEYSSVSGMEMNASSFVTRLHVFVVLESLELSAIVPIPSSSPLSSPVTTWGSSLAYNGNLLVVGSSIGLSVYSYKAGVINLKEPPFNVTVDSSSGNDIALFPFQVAN